MMTVIAAVNIIQVYLLIRLGNEVQARWKRYNEYCIDHEEGIIPDFYGNPSQKEMTYVERAKQYVHTEPGLCMPHDQVSSCSFWLLVWLVLFLIVLMFVL